MKTTTAKKDQFMAFPESAMDEYIHGYESGRTAEEALQNWARSDSAADVISEGGWGDGDQLEVVAYSVTWADELTEDELEADQWPEEWEWKSERQEAKVTMTVDGDGFTFESKAQEGGAQ